MLHKKSTRFCCLVLLLVLLGQSLSMGAAATGFSDVPLSGYYTYYDAINYVSDNGYMAGTGSGKFSPDVAVDRGMFVTVLYSFAGKPSVSGTLPFTDVSSSDYYYNAVRWAYANGVVSGSSDTTFSPNMIVTREQAMVFLRAYATQWLNNSGNGAESITSAGDYSNISTWARTAMAWSIGNGILIRSNESSSLYPKAQATRKELALWICRFGQNVIGLDFTKDTFAFTNTAEHFMSATSDHYLITEAHYNRLINNSSENDINNIESLRQITWRGSCYGMSLCAILDKRGQINYNANYANGCGTIHTIPSLRQSYTSASHITAYDKESTAKRFTQAESAINYYFLSQMSYGVVSPSTHAKHITPSSGQFAGMGTLLEDMAHGGQALLCFFSPDFNGYGHAVVLNGSPRITGSTGNTRTYSIPIYDPNSATPCTMAITWKEGAFTECYVAGHLFTRGYYYTNFEIFRALDIDGGWNATLSVDDVVSE